MAVSSDIVSSIIASFEIESSTSGASMMSVVSGPKVWIDLNSLDNELINQPILYAKYSNAWAMAIREQARAKEKLNMVKADLDSKARKSWEILGFDKRPSEPQIAVWIPNLIYSIIAFFVYYNFL